MSTHALIGAEGVVTNIIVLGDDAFSPPDGFDLIAIDGLQPQPGIGWRYEAGDFTAPALPDPRPAAPPRLSFLEFMDLFTEEEQLAIAGAAMTDVATKLWYDRAVGAQYIDLGDERLAAGLQKMVDAKLLTVARRNRVLKGQAPA